MTVQVCISYLCFDGSALPCVHEVGISPLLRRIEKLDVHRNSNFMSLIALNALQIKIEPVSLLEIVRSLSGCLNRLYHLPAF